MTYKPDIADQRESPATSIGAQLLDKGASVSFHDPYVEQWRLGSSSLPRVADLEAAIKDADAVVLLQNHRSYRADDLASIARAFLDTRGVTTHPKAVRL